MPWVKSMKLLNRFELCMDGIEKEYLRYLGFRADKNSQVIQTPSGKYREGIFYDILGSE
jgi:hypothetical protein